METGRDAAFIQQIGKSGGVPGQREKTGHMVAVATMDSAGRPIAGVSLVRPGNHRMGGGPAVMVKPPVRWRRTAIGGQDHPLGQQAQYQQEGDDGVVPLIHGAMVTPGWVSG